MKVLFSQLKKYLPELKADHKEMSKVFTMIGYNYDRPTVEVEYLGNKDSVLDLEVRQNRADCLGLWGLSRELSAYYNISRDLPNVKAVSYENVAKLDIEVKAKSAVKTLRAVRFENVTITQSPEWLQEYLKLNDINPINNIVDLTNYVMLETAHPSHAFDAAITGDKLVWEINPEYKKFISLDGTEIELDPETLSISNGSRPMALAGIVGGKESGVSENTKNIIVEMAVYDGALIRRNARSMKTITEASTRLEKFIDPLSIDEAFNWLVSLIEEHSKGNLIGSFKYEQRNYDEDRKELSLDLDKVEQLAGIEITHEESKTYLKRLGFEILSQNGSVISIKRPVNRLDVEMAEDAIEEIIRMKGYDKIPDNFLQIEVTKQVTPKHLILADELTNSLVAKGFDEVRSWILVDEESNNKSSFSELKPVRVTNSINEEVPFLRQSIAVSLYGQMENYMKNGIDQISIFEIGKVFSKKDGSGHEAYEEHDNLGILINNKSKLDELRKNIEILLRESGATNVTFTNSKIIPQSAHPRSCWDINVGGNQVGIIYTGNETKVENSVISEINIHKLQEIIDNSKKISGTIEVEKRLISLDTNILLENNQDMSKYIQDKISGYSEIWNWEVIDKFEENNKIKYTIRVKFVNVDESRSKEILAQLS